MASNDQFKAHRARWKAEGRCTSCASADDVQGSVCGRCKRIASERRAHLKEATLDAYGRTCACCGETHIEFLSVDHVDNAGAEERRSHPGTRANGIHEHLRRLGYPPTHRLLCMNCNTAIGFHGYCPHRPDDPAFQGPVRGGRPKKSAQPRAKTRVLKPQLRLFFQA